jgi:hypothetical protein
MSKVVSAAPAVKTTPPVASKKTVAGNANAAEGAAPVATATPVEAPAGAAPAVAAPATKKGGPGILRTSFDINAALIQQRDANGNLVVDGEGKPVLISAVKDGKLVGTPTNYDFNKNSALKEEDFIDEATYLEFKAAVADVWAKRYVESAQHYRETAKRIRTVGKPEDRKRLQRLEKMRKDYQQMNEALFKEGLISKEEYESGLAKMAAAPTEAAAA